MSKPAEVAVALDEKTWDKQRSDLKAFDELMDYNDIPYYLNIEGEKEDSIEAKDAVMIACYSGNFFRFFLQKASAYPVVVTTGLMAPEAYVLFYTDTIHSSDENSVGYRVGPHHGLPGIHLRFGGSFVTKFTQRPSSSGVDRKNHAFGPRSLIKRHPQIPK